MFGFLQGARNHEVHRQAYARVCQLQHAEYGLSTLAGLSYEAVALYLLCVDAGAVSRPDPGEPRCCRLRRRASVVHGDDAEVGRHCAAAGLLLVDVKLQDDVRDDGSWTARFLRWAARRKFQSAKKRLSRHDPELLPRIERRITEHLALERERSVSDLDRYANPTAEAFAELFGSITPLFPGGGSDLNDPFRRLGFFVGRAIIQFDCGADWWQDARRGRFNPVRTRDAATAALTASADSLLQGAAIARQTFGEESEAARLFVDRARSLLRRPRTKAVRLEQMERAGLTREPGYTYAFCDGCDCGGCDCACDGCAAGGDAACHCADPACWQGPGDGVASASLCGECCIVLPCECCAWRSCESRRTKSAPVGIAAPVLTTLIGKTGVSVTQLTPAGVVEIDEIRHAALAEGSSIDSQRPILVTAVNAAGLVVKEAKPTGEP